MSDNDDNAAGIIVLGAPRSGTTLVRRILDAHPRIACPGETNLLAACARFLADAPGADGLRFGVLNGLAYAGFEPDDVIGRLRAFAESLLAEHAARAGKPRWAEKSAFDAFHLDAIERMFGDDARYVCVVRHGMDTACSMKELADKVMSYLPELHEYVKRYASPLEAFAHAWADIGESMHAFAARRAESAIVVRYEDLVADPPTQARRIVEHCGEAWDDALLDAAMSVDAARMGFGDWKTYAKSGIDASSVGRWTKLPAASVNAMAVIVNPTLAKFGYEPVAPRPEMDEAERRRRYQMGLMLNAARREDKDERHA